MSGFSFVYDPALPDGERVVTIELDEGEFSAEESYSLATNEFIALGGDGCEAFEESEGSAPDEVLLLSSLVIETIEEEGPINPVTEGRIEVVGWYTDGRN